MKELRRESSDPSGRHKRLVSWTRADPGCKYGNGVSTLAARGRCLARRFHFRFGARETLSLTSKDRRRSRISVRSSEGKRRSRESGLPCAGAGCCRGPSPLVADGLARAAAFPVLGAVPSRTLDSPSFRRFRTPACVRGLRRRRPRQARPDRSDRAPLLMDEQRATVQDSCPT
jgi:hypothetical protein